MLKKRGMLSLLCVLVVFSFALVMGCAQPPTEEMAKADKAVADAKAKEADVYAAEAFKKAEDAFKKAKDQVAAKKYKEEVQAAIGKWSVDLAMAKDKLQGEKISEAFGELNAMMTAVGAKKDEIAKLIASAPAAPEKKKK
jgi:type II secretory pathway component PulM